MLISHAHTIAALVEEQAAAALRAMGETAVALVRRQMQEGYEQPVVESGALLGSIAYVIEGNTLHVGTPLSYAAHVHDGTTRMPGRPFLADGLLGGISSLEQAAQAQLHL